MKKLFVAMLLISGVACAQPSALDTVYVRYLQLQAQDWLWLTGKVTNRPDSLTIKGFRTLRKRAQEVAPIALTGNVLVDSLPGRLVVEFYRVTKMSPAGEIALRYAAITNAISAKTVLAPYIALIDASATSEFVRSRELGKYDMIDQ